MSEVLSPPVSKERKVRMARVQVADIGKLWDFIRPCILGALPPTVFETETVAANILKSLLLEELQCWFLYRREDGKPVIYAVATTCIDSDSISGNRNLLLYSLYGLQQPIGESVWTVGLTGLLKYKDRMLCQNLIAYTDQEDVVKRALSFGGDARFKLIRLG
jgi:hypothetical protein